MAQFQTIIPFDHISFYKAGITLGKGIVNFFLKNNITHVVFILNFHDNSLIIQRASNKGYPIILEVKRYRLYNSTLNNFIQKDYYKARKLNQDSIIVEGLVLKSKIYKSDAKFITIRPSIIVFGDMIWAEPFLNDDKLILSIVSKSLQANNAATPSSTVSPVQEPPKKTIVNKEYPLNEIPGLSGPPMPTSEAQDRADKAYSRLILGE